MEIHRLGLLLCKKFLNRLADGILLIMFLIMIFPLFMLAVNSFMGKQELLETRGSGRFRRACPDTFFPAISDSPGLYPAFAGLSGIFYGFLEFYDSDGRRAVRTAFCGGACGMGFCEVPFSWEENVVVIVYASDDSAFSGYDGFRISGFECG